jgi:hypothetical protein
MIDQRVIPACVLNDFLFVFVFPFLLYSALYL